MPTGVEREKQLAAVAAAALVEPGMTVGLGTGTTVNYLLAPLAARHLDIRCVATSPATENEARRLGLRVEAFTAERLDMAIDGADQVTADGWLVKGGGAAHTREKLVAVAAARFVVVADSTKPVAAVGPPVPLELLAFGLEATVHRLGAVRLRECPPSPDGGVIADFVGPVSTPSELGAWLDADPGVVSHGLFPPSMVSMVLVGRGETVERFDLAAD